MLINGWDIAQADAVQWTVEPGFYGINNDSEWVRGSPIPELFKNQIDFKPIKITLLVKYDRDRQAILNRCSLVLSRLLEPAELILDDFPHRYYGILSKHNLEENPLKVPFVKFNRAAKLTLEFNCYEYAVQEDGSPYSITASGATTIAVVNPGNITTPAIVEITPQIGAASIILTGICADPYTGEDLPVTVRELTTGNKVILDGVTGLITQNGAIKAGDVDIWTLPALVPGDNKITVNNNRMDVTVRFRPCFM